MISTLAKRLKQLREEFGYLQKDIAEKLDMSTSGYGFYETGRRTPDAIMINKLCEIFDVDSDYLLGRSDVKKNDTELYTSGFHSLSTNGLNKDDIDLIKAMVEQLKKKNK